MNYYISIVAGIMLALNLSNAIAGNDKSKSMKNANPVPTEQQPGTSGQGQERNRNQADAAGKGNHTSENKRDYDGGHDNSYRRNERSQEMLDQRDKRKEMKSEYKSDRVPGQEGRDNVPDQNRKPRNDNNMDDSASNEKKP